MRKAIYAFGIATFLAMLVFTVVTTLNNPYYGMSEVALAQGTTTTTTDIDEVPDCAAGGCGAISCSYSGTIGPVTVSNSVSCGSGYFACCHITAFCFDGGICPPL